MPSLTGILHPEDVADPVEGGYQIRGTDVVMDEGEFVQFLNDNRTELEGIVYPEMQPRQQEIPADMPLSPEELDRFLADEKETLGEIYGGPPSPADVARDVAAIEPRAAAGQDPLRGVRAFLAGSEKFLRGAAARGNEQYIGMQQMLNPWMPQSELDRVAAERAWVEQQGGVPARAGSIGSDIITSIPLQYLPGMGQRIAAEGMLGAVGNVGDVFDRSLQSIGAMVGAGAGETGSYLLGKFLKPVRSVATPAKKKMVEKAQELGVPVTAGDVTGSDMVEYWGSALESIPATAGSQAAKRDAQRMYWQSLLLRKAGVNADAATSDVLERASKQISNTYRELANTHNLTLKPSDMAQIRAIRNKYVKGNLVDETQKGQIIRIMDELTGKTERIDPVSGQPLGVTESGDAYMNFWREANKLVQRYKGRGGADETTAEAISELKTVVDNAFERTAREAGSPALGLIQDVNKEAAYLHLITDSLDKKRAVEGMISPDTLWTKMQKRYEGVLLRNQGDQEFADIVRVGKDIVSQKPRSSGTAERSFALKWLTGGLAGLQRKFEQAGALGGGMGAGGGWLMNPDPVGAVAGGLAGAGTAVGGAFAVPMAMQKSYWNPEGWLARGIFTDPTRSIPLGPFGDTTIGNVGQLLARSVGAARGEDVGRFAAREMVKPELPQIPYLSDAAQLFLDELRGDPALQEPEPVEEIIRRYRGYRGPEMTFR